MEKYIKVVMDEQKVHIETTGTGNELAIMTALLIRHFFEHLDKPDILKVLTVLGIEIKSIYKDQ